MSNKNVNERTKWTVYFDYRKNIKGRTRSETNIYSDTYATELVPWLAVEANKKKIYGMRLFYVVKPNAEDVVKFGIAGTKGESGAWSRLAQYGHSYGQATNLNPCTGVQLLFLAGNKYNKDVLLVDSDVFKKEAACKVYFRSPEVNAHLVARGFERLNLDRIAELFSIIDDPSNKTFGDVETERRTSQRLQQQDLIATDKILKITGHTTAPGKSSKMTKYTCYWNRAAVLTKEKLVKKAKKGFTTEETEKTLDHETPEFAHNIILFPGGDRALEVYKILHPDSTFRD